MRRGIVIGDTGDLKVQVVRDAAGVITQGLVVSDNDGDCDRRHRGFKGASGEGCCGGNYSGACSV